MKNDQVKVLSQKTLLAGRVFDLVSEEFLLPNGKKVKRDFISHPGAVIIIPRVSAGRLLMIRQYRHAIREYILEFPAGTLERGEIPLECAKREVIEECGRSAQDWIDLGVLVPAPGFCNEIQRCFLADNLKPAAQNLDEDEIIEVAEMSVSEIEAAIAQGQIKDAKSIAILARAKFMGLL